MNKIGEWLFLALGTLLVVLGFFEENEVLKVMVFTWSAVLFATARLYCVEDKLDALKKDLYSLREDLEIKEAIGGYLKKGSSER